ncbi:MAG: hypothetical protein IPF55_18395 [Rhodoferax sp.]|nr:hypothetical protein [Rhodoferax sp.]
MPFPFFRGLGKPLLVVGMSMLGVAPLWAADALQTVSVPLHTVTKGLGWCGLRT